MTPAYMRDLARLRAAGRCTWVVDVGIGRHGWALARAAERGTVLVVSDLSEPVEWSGVRGSAVRIASCGAEWSAELAQLVRAVAEHAAPVWLDDTRLPALVCPGVRCAPDGEPEVPWDVVIDADYCRREDAWYAAAERAGVISCD